MRSIRTFALVTATLGIILGASQASAQRSGVSLEGRLGVALPVGELSDRGAGSGLSLAGDLMYTFSDALTGYIGLSHDRFSCDNDTFCRNRITSNGFQTGLKFLFRRDGSALPWLRAGLIGQSLDTRRADSGMELGIDGGAGIDFDVTPNFALVPALQLRAYSADLGATTVDTRYFVISLGGYIHF
jgi:hypothetical protein